MGFYSIKGTSKKPDILNPIDIGDKLYVLSYISSTFGEKKLFY